MTVAPANLQKKIDDCFRLYKKYGGLEHTQIEREMRELGWHAFSRRVFYRRGDKPGWPERYGWPSQMRNEKEVAKTPHSAIRIPQFEAWLKTLPGIWNWDMRHLRHLYKKLRLVTLGKCKRLMIFMPPRHGKSELVTVRYSAWRIKQDPSLNVIVGGYSQNLANRFSRKIKRVLCDDADQIRNADCGSRIESNEADPDISTVHLRQREQKLCPLASTNPHSAVS